MDRATMTPHRLNFASHCGWLTCCFVNVRLRETCGEGSSGRWNVSMQNRQARIEDDRGRNRRASGQEKPPLGAGRAARGARSAGVVAALECRGGERARERVPGGDG